MNNYFRAKYFTTSKIALHITHVLTILVTVYVAYVACKYLSYDTTALAVVLSSLMTAVSAVLTLTTKFYMDKANADSDRMNKKEERESRRLEAVQITQDFSDGKISLEGVQVYKFLMSNTETSLYALNGGGITQVDTTTYAQEPTDDPDINTQVSKILEHIDNNSTNGM